VRVARRQPGRASLATPVLGTLPGQPAAAAVAIAPVPALLLPFAIPDLFALAGVHVHVQGLVLDPGAAAGGAFPRGLHATIGG
jgi:hypothetical protein